MATKTEVERISVVETKVDAVLTELKEIKTSINNLDKKFAAKWVQTIVGGLVGIILVAFIGVIVAFFIPAKPTTTQTTTTNTPTGSTSTTTPAVNANANAQADSTKASDSQSSGGGLLDEVKKGTGL